MTSPIVLMAQTVKQISEMIEFKQEGLFQRAGKIRANGMNNAVREPIQDMYYNTVTKSMSIATVRLLKFSEVAEFQKINPFILMGYRGMLTTRKCYER
ncbi:hypothetical protein C0J52_12669 [Blattella germanica]|nr:hypothetical protein C0J52_12669 [Blattella germanica]